MIRKILKYPNPLLREPACDWPSVEKRAESSELFSEDFRKISTDLRDTLADESGGLALAANQIGIKWNMIYVEPKFAQENFLPDLIINPKLVNASSGCTEAIEGCLSFPGISLSIPRHDWIEISFSDSFEERYGQVRFDGLAARMLQHELDHLSGKLFVDYVPHRKKFEIRSLMLKQKR